VVFAYFKYYHSIRLEGLKKTKIRSAQPVMTFHCIRFQSTLGHALNYDLDKPNVEAEGVRG